MWSVIITEMMTTDKAFENRSTTHLPNGKFAPGNNANPSGRPKGKTLKEFAREFYLSMSDDEKRAYILALEEKRPGFAWAQAEGLPQEDKRVSISVPRPILGGATGAINQAITEEILDNPSSDVSLNAPQTETSDDKSE